MTTSTKSQIFAMLTEQPRPLSAILERFTEAPQRRGAASVLAYLRTSGEIAEDTAGNLYLTGNAPAKRPRVAKAEKPAAAPSPQHEQENDDDPPQPEGDALLIAAWDDGDVTLKRGDLELLISADERTRLLAHLRRFEAEPA